MALLQLLLARYRIQGVFAVKSLHGLVAMDLIGNVGPDQHRRQLLLFCAAVACLLDLACCALLIVFLLSRALSNEVVRNILAVRVDEETWIGFTAFQ